MLVVCLCDLLSFKLYRPKLKPIDALRISLDILFNEFNLGNNFILFSGSVFYIFGTTIVV